MIAGINIGSVTAKTVIMDESRKILSHSIVEEGIVHEASPKISMGKEIHLEQSNQIRKRPVEFRSKLEKPKDQHSNQCCPNR